MDREFAGYNGIAERIQGVRMAMNVVNTVLVPESMHLPAPNDEALLKAGKMEGANERPLRVLSLGKSSSLVPTGLRNSRTTITGHLH